MTSGAVALDSPSFIVSSYDMMNEVMTKIRIRTIYYILRGLFWFSTAMISALYVLFLVEKGMNLAQVGIWAGVSTFTVILMEVPTGGLADTWGRARTFSLANIIISISILLMTFGPGLSSLYFGAALFGLGRALSSGSLDAWFIDALKTVDPDTNIEKETGAAEAVILGCLAAGSLVGSSLPRLALSFNLPSGLSALTIPLIADAALKIVLAALTLYLVREPGRHGSAIKAIRASFAKAPEIARIAAYTVRSQKIIPWLFIGGMSLAMGIGSVETFWQPRFKELTTDSTGHLAFGIVMASCFAAGALMSLAAPLLTRILRGKRFLSSFIFALLGGGALLLLSGSSSPGSMAIWMVLIYGLIQAASVPRTAMLNDVLPTEVRATMLSVDSLMSYVGFAGTIALGFLAESMGIPAVWRVAGIGMIISAFTYMPIGYAIGEGK